MYDLSYLQTNKLEKKLLVKTICDQNFFNFLYIFFLLLFPLILYIAQEVW